MAANHEDEYSYHFTVEYEDGQESQVSIDSRYKNDEEELHATNQVGMQYQEALNIRLEGCSRNYPYKSRSKK